jgi:hypothetical protein
MGILAEPQLHEMRVGEHNRAAENWRGKQPTSAFPAP